MSFLPNVGEYVSESMMDDLTCNKVRPLMEESPIYEWRYLFWELLVLI